MISYNGITYVAFVCCVQVVAEMAAIGFGLPKDAFTSLMKQVKSFQDVFTSYKYCYRFYYATVHA